MSLSAYIQYLCTLCKYDSFAKYFISPGKSYDQDVREDHKMVYTTTSMYFYVLLHIWKVGKYLAHLIGTIVLLPTQIKFVMRVDGVEFFN